MRCPICNGFNGNKQQIINHMETKHSEQLPENISTYRYAYSLIHGRDHGICVVCGSPTEWNNNTQKPNRLCQRKSCRETLRSAYKKNMNRVFGDESNYPINDPEHQKSMIRNRKGSMDYVFKDGGKISTASKDERDFLSFVENTLDMTSQDIVECPYSFYYDDAGKRRVYLPDFYLVNYNLIIEQKDAANTNPAFLEETRYKVKLKAQAVADDGRFNYIIVYGDDYQPLLDIIQKIRSTMDMPKKKKFTPLIVHNEAANAMTTLQNVLYLVLLAKGEETLAGISKTFAMDVTYICTEDGLVVPRSKEQLQAIGCTDALIYQITDSGDGYNQAIMDDLTNGIKLSEYSPTDFIFKLFGQYGRDVYISNKLNNNEAGNNVAVFVNNITLTKEEKSNEY